MFVGLFCFVLFVVALTDHVDFQIRVELLMHSAINIPQKCNLWEGNVFFYNFKKIVPILSILYDINMYRHEYSHFSCFTAIW